MYAESPEEYLNFLLDNAGNLNMLESPYSESLNELVCSHLGTHGSLPAFLSSLTMELFNKTTTQMAQKQSLEWFDSVVNNK